MLKLGKHKIEFYDSIDSLPFDRFNSFNKYVMLDAELGSDVRGLAFACLVRRIDGEKVHDFSIENMRSILDKLSGWGLEIGHVRNNTDVIKKN